MRQSESVVDCDVIEESLAMGEARWLRHGASGSDRGLRAQVVSDLVVLRLEERGLRAPKCGCCNVYGEQSYGIQHVDGSR